MNMTMVGHILLGIITVLGFVLSHRSIVNRITKVEITFKNGNGEKHDGV